jgi:nitrate/nitrite transporter NarK
MHLLVALAVAIVIVVTTFCLTKWEVRGMSQLQQLMTALYQDKPAVFWFTYVGIFGSFLALSIVLRIYVMAVVFAAFLVFAPLANRRDR